MGIEIAAVLKKLYPRQFDPGKLLLLLGNAVTVGMLDQGAKPAEIVQSWSEELAAFETVRRKYFLYK